MHPAGRIRLDLAQEIRDRNFAAYGCKQMNVVRCSPGGEQYALPRATESAEIFE
jgi:hypothetical protein